MLSVSLFADSKVRIYGGGGMSMGESADVGSGSSISYRFSTQFLFPVSQSWRFGFETGFVHLLESKYYGSRKKSYDYVDTLFMVEYNLSAVRWLSFQAGAGPYFSVGNDRGNDFGIFLGFGADIPVTDTIAIPIFFRVDPIIGLPLVVPITISTGLTF